MSDRKSQKGALQAASGCPCIAYESADGEDYGACHCGHSPEEHERDGCKGEAPAAPKKRTPQPRRTRNAR